MKKAFFPALSGLILLFCSCEKTVSDTGSRNTNPGALPGQLLLASPTDSAQAKKLAAETGLKLTAPAELGTLKLPRFENYDSALKYIQKMKGEWSRNYSTPVSMGPGSVVAAKGRQEGTYRAPRPCNEPGTYYGSIPGSGGIFSSFNVYVTTNKVGLSRVEFYTTGTPLGWQWTQNRSFFDSWRGCSSGLIRWGVSLRGFDLTMTREYHWNYQLDPLTCQFNVSWAPGPCI
ncbi:MAG TPA: hypothetical protein VHK69_13780 [Chitinophagaceae bacterium]|jgi:hypothetical protein|nr:hypothetical protein [Chitinophagaceae bacterium]